MRISTIAFANLRRRKGKAIFLVVGMGIGIGTVVALLSLSNSIREEIGLQLDRFGANIVVVPQSNSLSLDYGGVTVSGVSFDVHQLKNEDARDILDIPYRNRLSIIAPKILGVIETEGRDVLMAGVDFDAELKLKRWWQVVGRKPADERDVLLGYEVAKALNVIEPSSHEAMEPGSHHVAGHHAEFTLKRNSVDLAGRAHTVTGVLAPTGGREDGMIFGRLDNVQSLLGRAGQLSLIEVSALCKDCPVEDIVAQMSSKLPHSRVLAVQQSVRARTETVDRLARFSGAVSLVVLGIGALMIFTTVMGSVVERTKEIGVMRAIGFRRVHIMKELIAEVSAISVFGGLLGWVTGTLASWLALPYFSQTGLQAEVDPILAPAAIGGALLVGAVSSFYPVLRASRLDPSEAIRTI